MAMNHGLSLASSEAEPSMAIEKVTVVLSCRPGIEWQCWSRDRASGSVIPPRRGLSFVVVKQAEIPGSLPPIEHFHTSPVCVTGC